MVKNVYPPADVNATLHYTVNETWLLWGINGESYDRSEPALGSQGIFIRTYAPSKDITTHVATS